MYLSLPSNEDSYWLQSSEQPSFPALSGTVETDVAIIGGGIAGLTAAQVLQAAGLRVAVLEKHTIASGTTGGTTGKVTAQHGLVYAELAQLFGMQQTRLYAAAYQTAMQDIAALIAEHDIACDWTVTDNYVYTADKQQYDTFRREADIAASLGLPARFETALELPFPTVAAVAFSNQAYFNKERPVRYRPLPGWLRQNIFWWQPKFRPIRWRPA